MKVSLRYRELSANTDCTVLNYIFSTCTHLRQHNLPSNRDICFSHSCLPSFTSLFVFARSFSNFISFFSPCSQSAAHPSLASPLSACDRLMLYPFSFPLQLYSPGNWAQLVSRGAADFHRRFWGLTPSSAIYIIVRSFRPASYTLSFSPLAVATCKTPRTNTPQL